MILINILLLIVYAVDGLKISVSPAESVLHWPFSSLLTVVATTDLCLLDNVVNLQSFVTSPVFIEMNWGPITKDILKRKAKDLVRYPELQLVFLNSEVIKEYPIAQDWYYYLRWNNEFHGVVWPEDREACGELSYVENVRRQQHYTLTKEEDLRVLRNAWRYFESSAISKKLDKYLASIILDLNENDLKLYYLLLWQRRMTRVLWEEYSRELEMAMKLYASTRRDTVYWDLFHCLWFTPFALVSLLKALDKDLKFLKEKDRSMWLIRIANSLISAHPDISKNEVCKAINMIASTFQIQDVSPYQFIRLLFTIDRLSGPIDLSSQACHGIPIGKWEALMTKMAFFYNTAKIIPGDTLPIRRSKWIARIWRKQSEAPFPGIPSYVNFTQLSIAFKKDDPCCFSNKLVHLTTIMFSDGDFFATTLLGVVQHFLKAAAIMFKDSLAGLQEIDEIYITSIIRAVVYKFTMTGIWDSILNPRIIVACDKDSLTGRSALACVKHHFSEIDDVENAARFLIRLCPILISTKIFKFFTSDQLINSFK